MGRFYSRHCRKRCRSFGGGHSSSSYRSRSRVDGLTLHSKHAEDELAERQRPLSLEIQAPGALQVLGEGVLGPVACLLTVPRVHDLSTQNPFEMQNLFEVGLAVEQEEHEMEGSLSASTGRLRP